MTEVAQSEVKLADKVPVVPRGQTTQNQSTGKLLKMAQQTISNGPSLDGNHLKSDINSSESQPTKLAPDTPPPTSTSPQPSGPFQIRPPLNRSDSRQNFQYRPPFPGNTVPLHQQQIPPPAKGGPQSLSSQPLQTGYQPTSPVNSGPQSIILGQTRPQVSGARSPVSSQNFVQRAPPLGPGGTPVPPRLPQGNNATPPTPPFAQNQQRPIFRPQNPFPRPPLLAQRPQVFQQNSVPAFNRPRPNLEESFNRSQTLDSAEIDNQKHVEESRNILDQRPPSAASIGRSYSVTTSNPTLERKMTGSQESINISRQSSMENVYKKDEGSRPESRSSSRMGRIAENDANPTNNSTRPESRGEVVNGDIVTKSPVKEPPANPVSQPLKREEDIDEECRKRDMELKFAKSNKGDNDSGVDESTQGNDQSCNGDSRSQRKPNKSRTSSTTPTKGRSLSRGSKTPSSLQSPDSAATTPGSAEKKKVPMNKIQVGAAPSPNLKVVRSKIGSLDNAHYKPGGGKVKIESKKLEFKNAGPRIEAKNDRYISKGGEKKEVYSARSAISSASPRKIITQKLEWNAKSKIGSLDNASHKPKGGDKKIESVKLNFKDKAASKVGSKDNMKYQPGGGDVKIENRKIELHASSKIGSLDNVKHKPTGGDKKIFDDKDYLRQHTKSGKSSMDQSLSGSQQSVQSQEPKAPVADENLNQEH